MPETLELNNLLQDWIIPWGTNIVFALVIFVVGRIVARSVVNLTERIMRSRKMDEILISFISAILSALLLVFVIIAALSQLGIDTSSLVVIIGAAGLAIGLSLQSSLGNLASGVLLIVFRPFTKGNYVECGGTAGVVEAISIFTTTLTTPDNKEVIVPNSAVLGNNITNYSKHPTRRVDMVFGVAYGDDLRKAKALFEQIIAEDERVLKDPAPTIVVGALADSSVNFLVRPWVASGDYWPVLWDTTEKVKLRFDEAGLSIPFPQMDVHMHKAD